MRAKMTGAQAGACDGKEKSEDQKRRGRLADAGILDLLRPVSKEGINQPKGARWFCARVSGNELALAGKLSGAGVENLVPRETVEKVRKGKKIVSERAAFRGYAFIRFAPSAEAFHALMKLDEIRDFLGDGKEYRPILDAHMSVLKRKSEKADVDRMAADKTIGQGQQVRVMYGPLAGFTGGVLQVKSGRVPRARVFVEAFGELSRDVEMPLAFLQKL